MLHLPDTKLLITTFIRFNFCHVYESTSKRYFYKKKYLMSVLFTNLPIECYICTRIEKLKKFSLTALTAQTVQNCKSVQQSFYVSRILILGSEVFPESSGSPTETFHNGVQLFLKVFLFYAPAFS